MRDGVIAENQSQSNAASGATAGSGCASAAVAEKEAPERKKKGQKRKSRTEPAPAPLPKKTRTQPERSSRAKAAVIEAESESEEEAEAVPVHVPRCLLLKSYPFRKLLQRVLNGILGAFRLPHVLDSPAQVMEHLRILVMIRLRIPRRSFRARKRLVLPQGRRYRCRAKGAPEDF